MKNNACIFRQGVILCPSVEENASKIRVWRSLVSRLNGVQEASSSNLDTRTKNRNEHLLVPVFFFLENRKL